MSFGSFITIFYRVVKSSKLSHQREKRLQRVSRGFVIKFKEKIVLTTHSHSLTLISEFRDTSNAKSGLNPILAVEPKNKGI